MTLHLVEMPLVLKSLHRWAAGQRNLFPPRAIPDEGLALHHLLGEAFGPGILQPFRLLVAARARQGTLYGYSSHPAAALREAAHAASTPTAADLLPLEQLRSIPRPAETWRPGMRLGFDLRIRPVVRLAAAVDSPNEAFGKKGAEVDAFLPQALREGGTRPREAVYLDWLAARLGEAAELDAERSKLANFRRLQVCRNGREVEGPDAVIHGTLTVRDPKAFARLLARGVGRHRTYGYGMLLLRPPQRSIIGRR